MECKATTKPWVLLSSKDTLSDYGRDDAFAEMTPETRSLLEKRLTDLERLAGTIPWINKKGLIGYSLRQAHSEKDSGYEAAITIAKACMARIKVSQALPPSFAFVFPVIVISAPLIQCSLAPNGQLHLEEVEQGEYLFLSSRFGSCIRIVTANYLPAFATTARRIGDQLQQEFAADAAEITERYKSGRRKIRVTHE